MKIRHILVKHQYEAEDILRLLQQGKDFAGLAQKMSICSSARFGGDLGDLAGRKLDADFKEAIAPLQPGQRTGIVRTGFGYHIIERY